jgi:hypothetical protein
MFCSSTVCDMEVCKTVQAADDEVILTSVLRSASTAEIIDRLNASANTHCGAAK